MSALTFLAIALVVFTLIKMVMIVLSINSVKPPKVDPKIVDANNKAYDGDDDDWED